MKIVRTPHTVIFSPMTEFEVNAIDMMVELFTAYDLYLRSDSEKERSYEIETIERRTRTAFFSELAEMFSQAAINQQFHKE